MLSLRQCSTSLPAQAWASGLDQLELEHRKLSQLADKAKTLRAQNAQMAGEVANLPELKKAAADLQQQVVQMQHVRQQIQRLQVCGAARVCVWSMPLVKHLPMSACLFAFSRQAVAHVTSFPVSSLGHQVACAGL